MHQRRMARFLLVVALASGLASGVTACNGSQAGDGVTSPPSTTK